VTQIPALSNAFLFPLAHAFSLSLFGFLLRVLRVLSSPFKNPAGNATNLNKITQS
jgi:hypothetical protein